MKTLRRTVPMLALAAWAAAGCMLTSGQFVINYDLQDPTHVVTVGTLPGQLIDFNTVSEYNDHKDDLKRVEDLALVGDITNNLGTNAEVDVWIVPSGALNLTPGQVQAQGVHLWGPIAVAGNSTERVDWDRSSTLFVGRQALIDEIKGDGRFSLYIIGNGTYDLTIRSGSVIAVIGAAQ
jgi:hypothetical protein